MAFDIYISHVLKNVLIIPAGLSSDLEEYEPIGSYNHPDDDQLGSPVNHVLWHHVRDVLYAAGYENPSHYTVGLVTDGEAILPLVPGPLELIVEEQGGFDNLTREFDLASPDVIFGLAAKLISGNPVLTITHGGQPLQIVKQEMQAGIIIVMALGQGLTMERAELKITVTGGSVGGGFMRINEVTGLAPELIGGEAYYYGSGVNDRMHLNQQGQGGRLKFMQATLGISQYSGGLDVVTNNPGHQRYFTGRIIEGTEIPDCDFDNPDWVFNSTWTVDPEGGYMQNRPGGSAYFGSKLPIGTWDLGAAILEVNIAEGSAIRVGGEVGATSYGETVYGPYQGEIKLCLMGMGMQDFRLYILGVASIRSVRLLRDIEPLTFSCGDSGIATETVQSNYFYSSRYSNAPIMGVMVEMLGDNFEG